jgi:hypothetical protein
MPGIDPTFTKICQQLVQAGKAAESSMRNLQSAPPENLGCPSLSEAAIRTHFDRTESTRLYQDTLDGDKKLPVKMTIAAKLQNDFLASVERDFKLLRTRRVRSVLLEAVRRGGHGSDDGPIVAGIQYAPQQILQVENPIA